MPAFTVPQGVLLRLIWRKGGVDAAVNVLGAVNPTAVVINQALANTLSTAIQSSFTSSGLRALMAPSWSLNQIGVRDINTANHFEFIGTAAAQAGSGVTDPLPDNVAYCATIRTLLAGKRYRGRYYQVGIAEASNDANGQPSTGAKNAVIAFLVAIQANLTTSALTGAVLSRVANVGTPWDTIVARNTTWSTQRRRLLPGI